MPERALENGEWGSESRHDGGSGRHDSHHEGEDGGWGDGGVQPQAHRASDTVSVEERGAFSHARCTCGWRGPARRARSMARDDAEDHSGKGGPATGER